MTPQLITSREAAALVPSGATVVTDGFTMMGVAEEVLSALEQSFLEAGKPNDLTVVHAAGQSNRVGGFEHFANEKMVRRVVGSHWGLMPKMSALLGASLAECVCLPQGQITATFRAIAAGRPGHLSKIGLGTFVDPRQFGGKVNEAARASAPDYVELLELAGEEYLFYRSFPVDVAIIRASAVDTEGNCSQDEEAVFLDTLAIAQAARNSGGIVICQAKRLVEAGAIEPRRVTVPGCLIDYVVPVDNAETGHRQTDAAVFDPAYVTRQSGALSAVAPIEFSPRLVVGRRAAGFLRPGDVVNLGTGIPGDTIGPALAERGAANSVLLTLESGVYGGVPAGGVDFGIALSPSAIVPQSSQFDYYNGGGLDATFMGLGQVDAAGNVNVSALGGKRIGCGGFIDITQSAKRVHFCFIFDGKFPKFVPEVDELSFSGGQALRNGQEVRYISDKAVFSLGADGLVLDEVAPGISPQEVLAAIPFPVRVSDTLAVMPTTIFSPWLPPEEVVDVAVEEIAAVLEPDDGMLESSDGASA